MTEPWTYSPAWWLPGPHLRTIWGRFFRRTPPLATQDERWSTDDGDFIDLVRLAGPEGAPRLVILHGLEGTPRSHYVRGLFHEARRRGWSADLMVFRGCGRELNRTPRFYHSGETTDLAAVVARLMQEDRSAPFLLAGVSLGGNVLLKWLGELGEDVPPRIAAAAAVSVPFDLARASHRIGHGFSRIYQSHFLRSLRRKAIAKFASYPGLVARARIERARSLFEFDDVVTAPVHGFTGAGDYYTRSSAVRYLASVRIPALLLSARDDPFLPAEVLGEVEAIAGHNPSLHVEFHAQGGHVGFVSGANPFRPFYYAEWRVCEFLSDMLTRSNATHYDDRHPVPAR